MTTESQILSHLPLIDTIVCRHGCPGHLIEDAKAAMRLALVKAAGKLRESTARVYLKVRLRGALQDFLRVNGKVELRPVHAVVEFDDPCQADFRDQIVILTPPARRRKRVLWPVLFCRSHRIKRWWQTWLARHSSIRLDPLIAYFVRQHTRMMAPYEAKLLRRSIILHAHP